MKYTQRGRNDKYPRNIETWRYGEPVPEWMSDVCKVKFIDALGNITLDYRETNTGGLEFISSAGDRTIISVGTKEDYVCWGDSRLFTLRPIQLDLLYKKKEK